MKFVFVLSLLFSLSAQAQDVELVMNKTELKKGEPLQFVIKASPEHLLEIVVFTEEHLVLHQTSRLATQETPFDIDMKEHPAGKYFILITGDDIHVQRNFVVTE